MQAIKLQFKAVSFSFKKAFQYVPTSTVLLILIYIFSSSLPYASSYILGKLVDQIVNYTKHGVDFSLWGLLLLYSLANGLPTLINNFRTYLSRSWNLRFSDKMELYLYKKREQIDIAHLESPDTRDLMERALGSGDAPILNTVTTGMNIIWDTTSFIIGTFLAVHFNIWVYFIVIISAVPGFIVDLKFAKRSWSIWSEDTPERRRFSDLRQYIYGRNGLIEIKLYQSSKKILDWMESILLTFTNKQISQEKNKNTLATICDVIAISGFSYGLYMVINQVVAGEIMVGSVVFMLSTLSNVRNAINTILMDFSRQYRDSMDVGDIIKFLDIPKIIIEPTNPKKLNLTSAPEIVFENVSFKYPTSENLSLKNINLTFKAGDNIGLVGNNGAGKTTLVKLLCRIYDPTEGRILINGVDLKDISTKEWWGYMAVMFQDYVGYDFLVKDAIAMGRSSKPTNLTKVIDSSKIAQSHDFILNWDKKYDEQLGVEFKGKEPSKGQKQKLSIAKVLYRDGLIMILDEPTASVDAESESKIFDSIENLPKDRTAILISHDFSTISACDKIFVLDKNHLVEEGNHKELMSKKGLYFELYNLQAKRFKK